MGSEMCIRDSNDTPQKLDQEAPADGSAIINNEETSAGVSEENETTDSPADESIELSNEEANPDVSLSSGNIRDDGENK